MNKVLLVEDNPGDADLTRLAFKEAGLDCELSVVDSGEQALDWLLATTDGQPAYRPDLILLDLNLPGMHGTELLDRIKSSSRLQRIPVIVMSSSAAEPDISRSYDLHVNSYIQKPMNMAGFIEIVRTINEFWLVVAKRPPVPV